MSEDTAPELPLWISSYVDDLDEHAHYIRPTWIPRDLALVSCLSKEGYQALWRSREDEREVRVAGPESLDSRLDRRRRLLDGFGKQAERFRRNGPVAEAVREAHVYDVVILTKVGDGICQPEWTGANLMSDWMTARDLLGLLDSLNAQRPMLEEEAPLGG